MRHLYVGTRKKGDATNVTLDRLYVTTDDGNIWLMNQMTDRAILVHHWTLEELSTHFDKWTDLGTIEDKVKISDVVRVRCTVELV